MKNYILILCSTLTLGACSIGVSTSSNGGDTPTSYQFSVAAYSLSTSNLNGCTSSFYGNTITCNKNSSTITMTMTYQANPVFYMVPIVLNGITVAPVPYDYQNGGTSIPGNCNFNSSTPQSTFSCTVTLTANNAESQTVNFMLNGSLGPITAPLSANIIYQ